MTKPNHNFLFGLLALVALSDVLGGIIWILFELLSIAGVRPRGTDVAPRGLILMVEGLAMFLFVIGLGRATEPAE